MDCKRRFRILFGGGSRAIVVVGVVGGVVFVGANKSMMARHH